MATPPDSALAARAPIGAPNDKRPARNVRALRVAGGDADDSRT